MPCLLGVADFGVIKCDIWRPELLGVLMETYDLVLGGLESVVQVNIERKKMKTCRLKVYPDGAVRISVPKRTSSEWVFSYIESKRQWIFDKLREFELKRKDVVVREVRNGASVRFLGEYLVIFVSENNKQSVRRDGYALYINTPFIEDDEQIRRQFDKWWKKESLMYLEALVDKFYPIIEIFGVSRPRISVRKMKTLWGSCSVSKGKVTFNRELTQAKPEVIEYIVLHELVHFLQPNHSKYFYDFLGTYMPDWKERKKALNKENSGWLTW